MNGRAIAADLTPEERLTAAAVILRDAVEELVLKRALQAAPDDNVPTAPERKAS